MWIPRIVQLIGQKVQDSGAVNHRPQQECACVRGRMVATRRFDPN